MSLMLFYCSFRPSIQMFSILKFKLIFDFYQNMLSGILFLLAGVHSQLYNTSLYSLGTNLVVNHDFSYPPLDPGVKLKSYVGSILGWNCSTKCQMISIPLACAAYSLPCTTNFSQSLDTNVVTVFPTISQDVVINHTAEYLLTIDWMAPSKAPVGKSIEITIDSVSFANITCTINRYQNEINQYLVNLTAGTITFMIQEYGPTPSDWRGFYITGVHIEELLPIVNTPNQINQTTPTSPSTQLVSVEIFDQIMFNNYTSTLNSLPGNRVFFYTIMNFMITLDRLQFYFYHRHQLTNSSQALLSNINTLATEKGSLPQYLLQNCNASVCNSINGIYEDLKGSFNRKQNYTDSFHLQKNPDGLGFFANNLDFFFYELPFSLLIYFLFSLIFKALFNYRISKYLRKYSFYGLILFIVYEGNIEQFAFYFFTECRNLFSFDFKHKLANVFMIYFFFLLIVFTVGGLLWFSINYKKLVKYFLEDSNQTSRGAILLEGLERSVYPLVFGAIHALLIDDLLLQTIVLFAVEVSYFFVKVYTLKSVIPLYKFKVSMLMITSLIRLCFIATFYLYEQQGHPLIVNLIHYDLVWLYLICWLAELLHDSVVVLYEAVMAIKGQICRQGGNKLRPKKKINERANQKINMKETTKTEIISLKRCKNIMISQKEIQPKQKQLEKENADKKVDQPKSHDKENSILKNKRVSILKQDDSDDKKAIKDTHMKITRFDLQNGSRLDVIAQIPIRQEKQNFD